MAIWEADFYRRPLQDEVGNPLWELLICDSAGEFQHSVFCPQSQASSHWLAEHLRSILPSVASFPNVIRVFRPQAFNLLETAGKTIGIAVEPTRRTPMLKRLLQERAKQYRDLPNYTGQPTELLQLDQPPPVPLPENLWGDRWRFASLPAVELVDAFTGRMIPILEMPEELLPLKLGLASTLPIPGVVIDGGRRSLHLARWLQQSRPASLSFITGAPDGLILEAGLVDRWVLATFEDADVKQAAQEFEQRKLASRGLHFLLVQPDDSGMTYSGFWLLQSET